jgi:LysR family glycine cleavage system transcriptional activator
MKKRLNKRNLPPLSCLRGFEAAVRHMSFQSAADELQLTQGAISRQIKTLEESLGVELFIRKIRQIELTSAGAKLFPAIHDALEMIERATTQLKEKPRRKTIVLSALPTLTSTWIMSRLHAFMATHSNIEVRIVASIEPANLLNDNIDIAIRVGRLPGSHYDPHQPRIDLTMVESWDGVQADELFPDILVPVCLPELLGRNKIKTAKDLLKYPLIHTSTRRFAWQDWLQKHGITKTPRADKALEFGHFFMSIEAALRGQGIAIVPSVVLSLYKGSDRLVAPLQTNIPSAGSYYMLTHDTKLKTKEVSALREWIISEAKELRS